jgi:hypothetical protein
MTKSVQLQVIGKDTEINRQTQKEGQTRRSQDTSIDWTHGLSLQMVSVEFILQVGCNGGESEVLQKRRDLWKLSCQSVSVTDFFKIARWKY